METMAAVLERVGEPLEVQELELLPARHGEVLVRYVASGVCHSDLHVIQGTLPHHLPSVLGHEGAGIVEAVGDGVSRVHVGDHVITSYRPSCGVCYYCTIGRPNLCDLRELPHHVMPDGTTRFRRKQGEVFHLFQVSSFSERAVLPENSVIAIRKDAPLEIVCLVSCGVATGAGAVFNRAQVRPGSTVVVFGCGGVGLNAVQAAAISGAAKVVAVDVFAHKLEWAREFGATHTIDAGGDEDVVARVREICGHSGADYAIEAVGNPHTMEQAFSSVHRGGMAVIAGVARADARISIDPMMLIQERVLTGTSFGSSRQRVDLPLLIDLFMDGRYKLRELVSQQIGLNDLNRAFHQIETGEVRRSVVVYS